MLGVFYLLCIIILILLAILILLVLALYIFLFIYYSFIFSMFYERYNYQTIQFLLPLSRSYDYHKKGDYEKAIHVCNLITIQDESFSVPYCMRAENWIKLGHHQKAFEDTN